jgi:uncharacterized protein (TIGR03083 family)
MAMMQGMDEATALLTTLGATASDAPTACAGWTAHELVAHLAAGATEMAELVEASVAGGAERPTRAFADREAPFVALADDELRERLVTEALRLASAIEALGALGPGRTVGFSGRRLSASDLEMHGRCEAAIHRWDLVGDDEISRELLAAPELTRHAVSVLNTMLAGSREAGAVRVNEARLGAFRARFGAAGADDVVLVVDDEGARLEMDEPSGDPTARSDGATRLLALWGRRSEAGAVRWGGDSERARQLAAFLWAPTRAGETALPVP